MLQREQVAVVTGAAGGIGRGIALALARRGLRVECLDIAREENFATAREMCIRDSHGAVPEGTGKAL